MLDKIFLEILNMNFTATFVIVFILMARLFLKKAPKVYSYGLWSVVLFRLICPFSFESIYSLLPTKTQPLSQDIVYMQTPQIDTGITYFNNAVNSILPVATPQASVNPLQIWVFIGSLIWIVGIAILLIYSLNTLVLLVKKLKPSILYRDNIFISPNISTAFVIGVFNPKIYLPATLSNTERDYILLHEQTHIKRLDHIIKLLSFLVLCLHWFNPLIWLAFFVSGKDMEMSCDETVIKKLGNEVKKDYSSSLLTLATGKRILGGIPLAFGEGDTKERIKNVLNYKKPSFWIVGVTAVVCTIVAVCFLTNPINGSVRNPYVQEYTVGQGNIKGNVDVAAFEKISQDFAIGANQYGVAVFKDPKIAFETFQKLYAVGIEFIQKEYDLPSFSHKTYNIYNTYGWQMTDGTEEQISQVFFVTKFLDIYENSFTKKTPNPDYVEPTIEGKVLSLNDVIILSQKGEALSWADFDDFSYKEIGFGLYIRLYEINELFSLWIGGGNMDSKPMYISLRTNTESEDSIDIRTESVTDFISRHNDNTEHIEATYSFAKLGKNGEVLIASSILDEELAKEIIFNVLIRSSAWEGSDINDLKECYLIRQTFTEPKEISDYYAYRLENGSAVLQTGTNGRYSILSDDLYESLEKLALNISEVGNEEESSNSNYSQSLTAEELKQTEEVVRNYFTNEAPYYEGIVSIELVPDDSFLYKNTGIEDEYDAGNIIIYKVLTGRDKKDHYPERSVSVARASKNATWKVINHGY